MKKLSLIGRKTYKYNENITIIIPTLDMIRGENDSDENLFWEDINLFTNTPDMLISELDSMGIDFERTSDYTLFILMLQIQQQSGKCSTFLFKDLNLYELKPKTIVENNQESVVLINQNGETIFNEQIYNDVSEIICYIVGHKKPPRKKFGNKLAKQKRIEYDREKKARQSKKENKENENFLDGVILRLVCNSNFPYNFETIGKVTIFNIIYSLKQIEKDLQVTDLMQTRLVGNDLSKLPREELSRFIL